MNNTNIQGAPQPKKPYEQPTIEVIELDATPLMLVDSPYGPYNDNGEFD